MSVRWEPGGRIFTVATEAAKVAVVTWGVLGLDEQLEAVLSSWPLPARYALAAVVGALILEVVLAFVVGPPRIQVDWTEPGNPRDLTEILVRPSARRPSTGVFGIDVEIPHTSVIGMLILRALMAFRPTLSIRIDTAPMTPDVKSSRVRDNAATITANDGTHGFDVDLGAALSRPGHWHEAKVIWTCDELRDDTTYNIDYRWVHRSLLVRLLLWTCVRKRRNVDVVRMVRK
ncbi:hypothetical protein ACFQRL_14280 [Microbacterium fluvii]|uniref:Uncharacterized protein n=1 Tax=Microbacterium fluvii TaxID=415215 RepID=A0ABW2HI49_9MICO|nr:hypothetical protein [Microbacterium fluvii]MCU4673758.1 hypothetical protein [Microbacterium fluvii]